MNEEPWSVDERTTDVRLNVFLLRGKQTVNTFEFSGVRDWKCAMKARSMEMKCVQLILYVNVGV